MAAPLGERPDLAESTATRRTIAVCFVAQNLAMGFSYGSFGPLLAANQQHFDISRTAAASGMSLVTLAIGIASPLTGLLLQRITPRALMALGALFSAIGYVVLAAATSYPLALLAYVLTGLGVAWTAILGPLTLVNRLVTHGRGKVLSIVNLPLLLFASPYLVAEMLPLIGRFAVLSSMAVPFIVLLPLLLLIPEHPAPSAMSISDRAEAAAEHGADGATIARSPLFWLGTLAIGIVAGTGATFVVHLVPYGVERGMSLKGASVMLSAFAGAGVVGTLLLGWLIDRIGAIRTIIATTLCQILLCCGLIQLDTSTLYVVAALLGIVAVPLLTLHSATMSQLFGPLSASRAVGLGYGIKLPFLFGFPPLAAILFDLSGGYRLPLMLCAIALGLATALLMLVWVVTTREPADPDDYDHRML